MVELKSSAFLWELCKPVPLMAKPRSRDGAQTYSGGSCLKWGVGVRVRGAFGVALAAAALARYPSQEIHGPIVGKLASSSCSVCLDVAPTRFLAPFRSTSFFSFFFFSFQSPRLLHLCFSGGGTSRHSGCDRKCVKCAWNEKLSLDRGKVVEVAAWSHRATFARYLWKWNWAQKGKKEATKV